VFLNVSTFRPGKRHMDLLKIFARLRKDQPDLEWRLWLVGDGKEYRRCKHWAAENGLGTRVRFFHFQHDPYPFYAGADVAVSVSREDSLPNFLIESQATSLPVIAYDCRGVEETCIPGETGIVLPPEDADQFLENLIEFARCPEKRARFAAKAPAFVQERFSRMPQAESTLSFLEEIAADKA
jgi:glycosyltransferase involved in cell wall biosynthesis